MEVNDRVRKAILRMKRHAEKAGIGISFQVGDDEPIVLTTVRQEAYKQTEREKKKEEREGV
jgi:predicted N-acyltransferase